MCRVRKEGEVKEEKIFSACKLLVSDLARKSLTVKDVNDKETADNDTDDSDSDDEKNKNDNTYDIFISYAHKAATQAKNMYDNLMDIDPTLKIFFDRNELRTGWFSPFTFSIDTC